jgi:hypothetical protein
LSDSGADFTRSRVSTPKKLSAAALSAQLPTALMLLKIQKTFFGENIVRVLGGLTHSDYVG